MKDIIFYKAMPLLAMIFLSFITLFKSVIFLVISLFLILPYLIHRFSIITKNKYFSLFFFLVLLGSIFDLFGTQNGIGGTINFIVAVGLTIFCVENVNYSRYMVLALCLYTLYFVYTSIFVLDINPNAVFEDVGVSRNYPGFLMIACCCYWGYFKYIKTGYLPLILPILCTIIAFYLDGRSSLGILFVFSLFCLYYRFRKIVIVFAGILCFIVLYFLSDILFLYSLTNIGNNGLETERYEIWSAYFDNIDLFSFILGLETKDVAIIRSVDGNPHNAFLNYHYRMGLFGVIGLFIIIYKSVRVLLEHKKYVLLFLVSLLLLRIFFDTCLNLSTDYILYTLFMYPLICNNKVFRKQRCSPPKMLKRYGKASKYVENISIKILKIVEKNI